MHGAARLSSDPTDEERWQLMKAGGDMLIDIRGSVYAALGQTTAGTPIEFTRRVNAFMCELRHIREQGLDERLRLRGADPSLYWTPVVREEHIGLESAQGFVTLGRLA
jgi:hypothetical protein